MKPLPAKLYVITSILLFSLLSAEMFSQSTKNDWTPLFNGKDLKGWKQLNGTAPYSIANGEIIGVLDIDSSEKNSFSEVDARWLEKILELIHV